MGSIRISTDWRPPSLQVNLALANSSAQTGPEILNWLGCDIAPESTTIEKNKTGKTLPISTLGFELETKNPSSHRNRSEEKIEYLGSTL